jgi:hypothetical protein
MIKKLFKNEKKKEGNFVIILKFTTSTIGKVHNIQQYFKVGDKRSTSTWQNQYIT